MAEVKLSSLRVTAEMDVQQYVRAASQKADADKGIVASSEAVGKALAAADAASAKAASNVSQISRMWLDGYASAAKFEKAVRDIGRALDKGMDLGRATAALDGVYRKFGQTADAATLAKTGFVALAPIVSALNSQYEAVAASADRAAKAQRDAASASNFQSSINSRLGVNRPSYDAAFSAGNLDAELRKVEAAESAFVQKSISRWSAVAAARHEAASAWNDEIAGMRRAEAGSAFQSDLNARLGVGNRGGSASASASAFQDAFAAEQRLSEEIALVDKAAAKWGKLADARAQSYSDWQDQVDAKRRAEAAEIDALRRSEAGAAFTQDLNARLGIGSSARANGATTSAFQDAAADAKRVNDLRSQLLPLNAELEKHKGIQRDVIELVNRGTVARSEAVRMLAAEQIRHKQTTESVGGMLIAQDKYSRGVGLARNEWVNLSRQAQDVFVSLTSGQSPMTVLIQQGTQIADVFASSRASFGAVFKQALTYVTPFTVAITGTTAAVIAGAAAWYAYAESQHAVEVALLGIGRGSGLAAEGINKIAQDAARPDRMSISTARSSATSFAATGKIDKSLIPGLTSSSYGYGILTGKSADDAGKDLATAFSDPVRGAEQLNERLGFLNAGLRDYLKNSMAAGDRTSAQTALYNAISAPLDRAAEKTTALGKAWNFVANAASNAANAIGKAATGPSLEEKLKAVETQIANLQSAKGFIGIGGRLAPLETQRDRLKVEIDYDKRQAEGQKREADASRLGLQGNDVVRSIIDDIARLESMRSNKSLLEKVIGDPEAMSRIGLGADQVREALSRVTLQLGSFKSATERAAEDGQIQIQQVMAYTLQQRAAVEAQKAYTDAIRSTGNAALASVEAENARNRVIAEANRQARDMLRDANMDSKLLGLTPYQRGLQQIKNEEDRWKQQNSGAVPRFTAPDGPPTPANTNAGAASLVAYARSGVNTSDLDGGFATKLRTLISGIDGIKITSGFRDEAHNARVGGVPDSQHTHGKAADMVGPASSLAEVRRRAAELGLRVIPSNNGAIHADAGLGSGRGSSANQQAMTSSSDGNSAFAVRRSNYTAEQQEGPILSATQALKAQESTLGLLRQSIGMTAQQQAELNAKMQLYADYARADIPVTDDLRLRIDEYARSAGAAAEQIRKIDFAKKQVDEWKSTEVDVTKGFFGDLVSGARQGKSAMETFSNAAVNALNKIGDKVLSMAIDSAFSGQKGGGLFGGLLSSIFGGLGGGGGAPLSLFPSANGNVFGGGNVIPFAKGGTFTNSIVSRPTIFPFANGIGLMGEAGDEAIMPLKRGANGSLGVQMHGGGGAQMTYAPVFNVSGDVSQETIVALRQEMQDSEARMARLNRSTASAIVGGEAGRANARAVRAG